MCTESVEGDIQVPATQQASGRYEQMLCRNIGYIPVHTDSMDIPRQLRDSIAAPAVAH